MGLRAVTDDFGEDNIQLTTLNNSDDSKLFLYVKQFKKHKVLFKFKYSYSILNINIFITKIKYFAQLEILSKMKKISVSFIPISKDIVQHEGRMKTWEY